MLALPIFFTPTSSGGETSFLPSDFAEVLWFLVVLSFLCFLSSPLSLSFLLRSFLEGLRDLFLSLLAFSVSLTFFSLSAWLDLPCFASFAFSLLALSFSVSSLALPISLFLSCDARS